MFDFMQALGKFQLFAHLTRGGCDVDHSLANFCDHVVTSRDPCRQSRKKQIAFEESAFVYPGHVSLPYLIL